jgi:hypothetical protein
VLKQKIYSYEFDSQKIQPNGDKGNSQKQITVTQWNVLRHRKSIVMEEERWLVSMVLDFLPLNTHPHCPSL